MNRVLLALALTFYAASAMAEWVKVGDSVGVTPYADIATIRKNGDSVRMWVLDDYKNPVQMGSNPAFLSHKSQYEFDCKEGNLRELTGSFHSENMGKGLVIYFHDYKSPEWEAVPPDSIAEGEWKIACGKK